MDPLTSTPTPTPGPLTIQDVLDEFNAQGPSRRLQIWYSSVQVTIKYRALSIDLDVPRLTYFPLAFSKFRQFFSLLEHQPIYLSLLNPSTTTTRDVFVRVHLPVGLLFDLHASKEAGTRWTLYVVTETPTFERRAPYPNLQKVEELMWFLWNSTKQNETIRHASIRRLQNLTALQTKTLQAAMICADFLAYWRIAKGFMNLEKMRMVPVRMYLSSSSSAVTSEHPGQVSCLQNLVPVRVDGHATTLRDCAHIVLYRLGKEVIVPELLDIVLHGKIIEWDQDLGELLEEEQYVDGWLYFTVRNRTESRQSCDAGLDKVTNETMGISRDW